MHRKVERMDVASQAVTVVTFTTNLVYADGTRQDPGRHVAPLTPSSHRYAVGFGVALVPALRVAVRGHIAVRHYFKARRGEAGARVKVYEVDGPLFFASAMPFIKQARAASHHVTHLIPPAIPPSRDAHPSRIQQLTVEDDPETVEVIFTQGELFDYTALDALNTLSKQCAAAAASEGSRVPAAAAQE